MLAEREELGSNLLYVD